MILFCIAGAIALVVGLAIENPQRSGGATIGAALCIWLAMVFWELAMEIWRVRVAEFKGHTRKELTK
jgi:hypothetical protein